MRMGGTFIPLLICTCLAWAGPPRSLERAIGASDWQLIHREATAYLCRFGGDPTAEYLALVRQNRLADPYPIAARCHKYGADWRVAVVVRALADIALDLDEQFWCDIYFVPAPTIPDQAVRWLARLCQRYPRSPAAFACYVGLADLSEAVTAPPVVPAAERAVRLAPRCALCWYLLGCARVIRDQRERGIAALNQAVRCAPKSSLMRILAADMLSNFSPRAAEAVARQAMAVGPAGRPSHLIAFAILSRTVEEVSETEAERLRARLAREFRACPIPIIVRAILIEEFGWHESEVPVTPKPAGTHR